MHFSTKKVFQWLQFLVISKTWTQVLSTIFVFPFVLLRFSALLSKFCSSGTLGMLTFHTDKWRYIRYNLLHQFLPCTGCNWVVSQEGCEVLVLHTWDRAAVTGQVNSLTLLSEPPLSCSALLGSHKKKKDMSSHFEVFVQHLKMKGKKKIPLILASKCKASLLLFAEKKVTVKFDARGLCGTKAWVSWHLFLFYF